MTGKEGRITTKELEGVYRDLSWMLNAELKLPDRDIVVVESEKMREIVERIYQTLSNVLRNEIKNIGDIRVFVSAIVFACKRKQNILERSGAFMTFSNSYFVDSDAESTAEQIARIYFTVLSLLAILLEMAQHSEEAFKALLLLRSHIEELITGTELDHSIM